MAVFSVIGGLDRICGNRLGLGKAYENGIITMGELALSMTGFMVLAPVIARVCTPFISPVYELIGADPAVFAGSFLACDMGGAQLANQLTSDSGAANLSGIVIASMLGSTVSFTIPIAVSSLSPADKTFAAKGILCGLVTIPVGIVAGGLTAGLPIKMILLNTVPVLVLSLVIALGLWKAEKVIIKAFEIFGWFIMALSTFGIVSAGIELTTGYTVIKGLDSIENAFVVIGQIAIVLTGALPLIIVIQKVLSKPIDKIGKKLNMNSTSVAGLIATLANSVATFGMVKDMDERGKVANMAFAVSGAFVFGDHLAFTAGYNSEMLPALIVGKLTAGILSVVLALLMCSDKKKKTA